MGDVVGHVVAWATLGGLKVHVAGHVVRDAVGWGGLHVVNMHVLWVDCFL